MNPMLFVALAVVAYFSVAESRAQIANYPDKPIKMMVGFSAGIVEEAARPKTPRYGRPVLVENKMARDGGTSRAKFPVRNVLSLRTRNCDSISAVLQASRHDNKRAADVSYMMF